MTRAIFTQGTGSDPASIRADSCAKKSQQTPEAGKIQKQGTDEKVNFYV